MSLASSLVPLLPPDVLGCTHCRLPHVSLFSLSHLLVSCPSINHRLPPTTSAILVEAARRMLRYTYGDSRSLCPSVCVRQLSSEMKESSLA